MSDLVRFDVGISGGLITSAEGKWVSYASHCASRDALVNVVDAQANEIDRLREVFASGASTMAQATDEIERLRDWQRRAIDLLTLGYDPPCEEYHPECPGCQAHDLIGGAQL